ncbi:MAG: hypothetical protein ACKVRN_04985 [Pyrinomonadaceae bacterium]
MRNSAYQRINITLPQSTIAMLETVAAKGSRSTFIDEAIQTHVKTLKQPSLRERVKQGAIARAERNLKMAEEWFHIEEELWQK